MRGTDTLRLPAHPPDTLAVSHGTPARPRTLVASEPRSAPEPSPPSNGDSAGPCRRAAVDCTTPQLQPWATLFELLVNLLQTSMADSVTRGEHRQLDAKVGRGFRGFGQARPSFSSGLIAQFSPFPHIEENPKRMFKDERLPSLSSGPWSIGMCRAWRRRPLFDAIPGVRNATPCPHVAHLPIVIVLACLGPDSPAGNVLRVSWPVIANIFAFRE